MKVRTTTTHIAASRRARPLQVLAPESYKTEEVQVLSASAVLHFPSTVQKHAHWLIFHSKVPLVRANAVLDC